MCRRAIVEVKRKPHYGSALLRQVQAQESAKMLGWILKEPERNRPAVFTFGLYTHYIIHLVAY